jgi:hypothetical protein
MSGIVRSLLVVAVGAAVAWGDVTTTLEGSRLVVSGDGEPESLVIEPGDGGIAVRGFGGTLVDGAAAVTVAGVQRLVLRLHEGGDDVTVRNVELPQGLDVRSGGGNDDVVLDGVVTRRARVRTGNGWDAVRAYGPSRLSQLRVSTGAGRDVVVLDGVRVPGDVRVHAGNDDDDVTFFATEVGDDVDVNLGNDDDVLVLADVVVWDDTDLDGDDGHDALWFSGYVWLEDDFDVDGFGDDWWW